MRTRYLNLLTSCSAREYSFGFGVRAFVIFVEFDRNSLITSKKRPSVVQPHEPQVKPLIFLSVEPCKMITVQKRKVDDQVFKSGTLQHSDGFERFVENDILIGTTHFHVQQTSERVQFSQNLLLASPQPSKQTGIVSDCHFEIWMPVSNINGHLKKDFGDPA